MVIMMTHLNVQLKTRHCMISRLEENYSVILQGYDIIRNYYCVMENDISN